MNSVKHIIFIFCLGVINCSFVFGQTQPTCDTVNDYYLDTATNTCKLDEINPDYPLAVTIEDTESSFLLTIGFNPLSTDHERLLDENGVPSDWTIDYRLAGQTCDLNSNEVTFDGFKVSNVDYFINRSFTGCNEPDGFDYTMEDPRSLPKSDPLYSLIWLDFGLVPDPLRTTETVKCKFNEDCSFTNFKQEYAKSLASFIPTAGNFPTLAGNIHAFVYGYQNLAYSNVIGLPGNGGVADLPRPFPTATKYCFQKRDATTDINLSNSSFAIDPTLNFHKINWTPFTEGPSANDGAPGSKKNGKSSIVKGLDSSMRYWLGNDNVLGK